jgi:hypothetical protein
MLHLVDHYCLARKSSAKPSRRRALKNQRRSNCPFFCCHLKPVPRRLCIDTNEQDASDSGLAPPGDENPESQPSGSEEWRVSASFSETAFEYCPKNHPRNSECVTS